jgi:hypothetical protein
VLLAWAVSCDSYELHDDGTADIRQAGIDTFHVGWVPLQLPVSVMVKVLLMEAEEAELEFHALGPNTEPLAETIRFPFVGTPGPTHRSGYVVSVVEALDFVLPVSEYGTHSIEISTDRAHADPTNPEHRRSIFLNVFRAGI